MKINLQKLRYNRPINNNFSLINVKYKIPYAKKPIILYDRYDNNLNNLLTKLKELNIEIKANLSPSPLSNSGLDESSKTKIRNIIYDAAKDNKIDEQTKNDLLYKLNFTGKKYLEEDIYPESSEPESEGLLGTIKNKLTETWEGIKNKANVIFRGKSNAFESKSISPFQAELEKIDSLDVSMSEDMENFLLESDENIVEGLMSNILEELPEGFSVDDDIYDILLDLAKDAVTF